MADTIRHEHERTVFVEVFATAQNMFFELPNFTVFESGNISLISIPFWKLHYLL